MGKFAKNDLTPSTNELEIKPTKPNKQKQLTLLNEIKNICLAIHKGLK